MNRLKARLCAALRGHLAGGRPEIEVAGRMLWQAFLSLSRTRRYHAAGPEAIAYAEIEAWCRVMRVPLAPAHVEIITALDEVWLDHAYRNRPGGEKDGVKTLPPISKHALNAAIFDATMG